MDCARFEVLLFEGLDRDIAADDRERMLSHARVCARCRDLFGLVRQDHEPSAAELADTFAAAIVASTSGKPCDRAGLLLASDETVRPGDTELLALHLEVCPDCAAVARALPKLRAELPALAEADPGARFVAAVMTATVGTRASFSVPPRRRPRRVVERLVKRPRLASEIAYAITMSALLVFGLPSASLSELPARVFDATRHETAAVERMVTERTGETVRLGRMRWAELTTDAATLLERSLEPGAAQTIERLQSWFGTVQGFAQDARITLLAPHLENLRSLWNENESDAVEPGTSERANP